jgi:uncharacterized protein (DUF58 family)
VLLILAALAFAAAPLLVVGVGVIALAVLSVAWVSMAARAATIERTLGAKRILEDEPLQTEIVVGWGRWGLPRAEIVDPLVAANGSVDPVPQVPRPRRATRLKSTVRFPRRGRIRLEAPSLVVRDGLDLARVVREGAGSSEVLVLPRTEPVRWMGEDRGGLAAHSSGGVLSEEAAVEVDGLRPYRAGTPASRIHWPVLARGAGLLERRLRAETEQRPIVVLDARCSGGAELLDAAVRAAASLALELGRRQGCGLLLPGDRRPIEIGRDLINWPAAHVRLALVGGGPGTRAPRLALGSLSAEVFYVAAQRLPRVPQGLRSGGQRAVLVHPAAIAAGARGPLSLEVAGCRGFALAAARRVPARQQAA